MRADFSCQPQRRPSHINFSIATNRCDSLSYQPYLSAASSILLPGWLLRCCLEWIGSGNDGLKWIWAPVALLKKIGKTCGQCNRPSQQANQALRILVVHNTATKESNESQKKRRTAENPSLYFFSAEEPAAVKPLRIGLVSGSKPSKVLSQSGKGMERGPDVLTSPNFSWQGPIRSIRGLRMFRYVQHVRAKVPIAVANSLCVASADSPRSTTHLRSPSQHIPTHSSPRGQSQRFLRHEASDSLCIDAKQTMLRAIQCKVFQYLGIGQLPCIHVRKACDLFLWKCEPLLFQAQLSFLSDQVRTIVASNSSLRRPVATGMTNAKMSSNVPRAQPAPQIDMYVMFISWAHSAVSAGMFKKLDPTV